MTNGIRYILQEFTSVSAYLEYIQSPLEDGAVWGSSHNPGSSFSGTVSFEEAVALAERGWPEGLEQVCEMAARLSEDIVKVTHIPEVTYDVVGDQLDIGRFVNGEPEDFMTLTPAEVERHPKVLHIVANITASGVVGTSTLLRKGAAVVALVDALEAHGKRCIVDCVSVTTQARHLCEVRVRVKDADAPVQLANLVFMLAHASSLRRLSFAAWEHLDDEVRRAMRFIAPGGTYGLPTDPPEDSRGDIYVPKLMGQWSAADAERFVLRALREQGIIIEDDSNQPVLL